MATATHRKTVEAPVEEAGANGRAATVPEVVEHAMRLTRDAILSADDVPTEDVFVPEWGGVLTVRGLTGRARDVLEARFSDGRGSLDIERLGGFRAAMVAQAAIDEKGALMFTDADVKALGEKSSSALQRVYEVVARLSAADPDDLDGIIEDLKSDPSVGTGSD